MRSLSEPLHKRIFIDLCRLLDEPDLVSADPVGENYSFERGVKNAGGGDGWADVWKRDCFAWEYKKRRGDLNAALRQLLLYASNLDNRLYWSHLALTAS